MPNTTAQDLELNDVVNAADGLYDVLDIDYLPNNDITLTMRKRGETASVRIRTRPGAFYAILD